MNTTVKNNGLIEIIADNDRVLYRGSYETCVKRAIIKESDIENWKEININDVPKYTEEDYKKEVVNLIREKYTLNDEFAILRKMMNPSTADDLINKNLNEFVEYNEFVENCKLLAKLKLNG